MSPKLTRRAALSLIPLMVTGLSVPVLADDNAAEAYAQDIGEQVLKVANAGSRGKATRGRFAQLLTRYVNLRGITLASLGTYQKQLPPGDMGKLNDLVTTQRGAVCLVCGRLQGLGLPGGPQCHARFLHRCLQQDQAIGSDEPIIWYLSPAAAASALST
ncbi:MAG: hypothetical protein U1E15_07465 [Hyphomicrobiales bacterium]